MEPVSSLPHSQVPATCPYPEPARSSLYPHIPLPHVPFSLVSFHQIISPGPMLTVRMFRNRIRFYGEELLAPRPTPNLEDHPLSVVRDCLFHIFVATLHIGGRSSTRNLRTHLVVAARTHLFLSWRQGPTYSETRFKKSSYVNVQYTKRIHEDILNLTTYKT
jgi:hypothetical protein